MMELRDRIIEEATKQFFQFGIRNITMDDIAISLGISKRTVYDIFKNKSELVQTCIKKLTTDHDLHISKVISDSSNAIEVIFIFMREGIKALNSINPVFFKDMEKLYPVLWHSIENESHNKRSELSAKLIQKGIKDGLFRDDLKIEIVSKLFQEQINLLTDDKVFPRDKYNHSEVFQNMIINFTRGISTTKGIGVIDSILQ